jgi:hypothetical protein
MKRFEKIRLGAGIALIAIFAIIFVWAQNREEETPPPRVSLQAVQETMVPNPGWEGGDLPLEPEREGTQIHRHIAVRVVTDDIPVLPPRDIGNTVRGFLAIHTHDQSGVIHVHQPKDEPGFKLSDVWTAWGLPVDAQRFGDIQSQVCIYQNGKIVSQDVEVKNKDDFQIVLSECSRPPLPPFDWKDVAFFE